MILCFGTRPEWIKIKSLIRPEYKLLFTGQHLNLIKENIKVDWSLNINESNNRLDSIISECLLQFPNANDSILVQGDTASAFACALAAFHRNLKIYYLEAGLRSFDLNHPYPEEGYRQMISRLSDVNLCPTELSKFNLINEKVKGKCFVVGNTILDNLVTFKPKCEYTNKVLITMHRRENHEQLGHWFYVINQLAHLYPKLKFIFPMHPNPIIQKYKNILTNVNIIDPLEHEELINLLIKCKLIITDSGGLQEEGSFFNKKVIVCRKTTERPEGIKTGHLFLCKSPLFLKQLFQSLIENYEINEICPYGDGASYKKILKIVENYITL